MFADIPVPTLITVEDQTSNMSDTQELGEKVSNEYYLNTIKSVTICDINSGKHYFCI